MAKVSSLCRSGYFFSSVVRIGQECFRTRAEIRSNMWHYQLKLTMFRTGEGINSHTSCQVER